jgi:hypothetical protein
METPWVKDVETKGLVSLKTDVSRARPTSMQRPVFFNVMGILQ